jgi:hypothetical protein
MRYFVFVELSVLEIQITFFVPNKIERVLRYLTATAYGNGDLLAVEIHVYDIERNVVFSVEVRELRKIELSFALLLCAFGFHFGIPPIDLISLFGNDNKKHGEKFTGLFSVYPVTRKSTTKKKVLHKNSTRRFTCRALIYFYSIPTQKFFPLTSAFLCATPKRRKG